MKITINFIFILIMSAFSVSFAETTIINVGGDILFPHNHTDLLDKIEDSSYFYQNIQESFFPFDLLIANLEFPILKRHREKVEKKWTYHLPEKYSYLLSWASLSAVVCANNHTMDYGEDGLLDLMKCLDDLSLPYSGIGKNTKHARKKTILKNKNNKIGLLSYSKMLGDWMFCDKNKPGTLQGYFEFIREDIAEMKAENSFIMVYFHWGTEYQTKLKKYQVDLARYCVDQGADIVLGSHSHRLMAIEKYKSKPIAYGLGNFLFGTIQHKNQPCGFMKLFVESDSLKKMEIHPFILNNGKAYLQPIKPTEKQYSEILQSLYQKSKKRNTELILESEKALLYFP